MASQIGISLRGHLLFTFTFLLRILLYTLFVSFHQLERDTRGKHTRHQQCSYPHDEADTGYRPSKVCDQIVRHSHPENYHDNSEQGEPECRAPHSIERVEQIY